MGGSYVISISLLTFEKWPSSDKPKDYSDFIYRTPEEIAMGASGEQLNESIITDIEHMVRGLKQDPNNRWANIDVRSNDSDKDRKSVV